jgi:predicted PurR-regulated permease PerM
MRSSLDLPPERSTVARAHDVRKLDVRTLILGNLVVLGIGVCFFLVYRFAAALFSLFTGITLGMAVKPAVEWLRRRGIPRWAGALAIYLGLSALLAGFVILVVPVVIEQAGTILTKIPAQFESLRASMTGSASRTIRRIALYLPASLSLRRFENPITVVDVGELLPYAGVIGRNLFTAVAVLLLGFYWTLEGDRRIRELVFLAPYERRREIRSFLGEVEHKVGAYLRGQIVVCLVIGVLALGAYSLIGLPYALVLGLIYAAGEAVPVLGPIIGTVAASTVALSVSPSLVPWVIGVAVMLQLIENYVLIPRVMKRAVGVNPLVTLLAITGFGSVLGVVGAILAIPMAATIQLLIDRFLLRAQASDKDVPSGRDRSSVLRYEVQQVAMDVRNLLRARESQMIPHAEKLKDAVETIATDLDRLLARAEGPP